MQAQYAQGQYMQGQYTQGQQQGQYMQGQYTQNQYQQVKIMDDSMKTFIENNTKAKDRLTTIGFIISILGLLVAMMGTSYGVIILFFEVYCGVQGLKTSKRNIAIATIVLVIISFFICIYKFIR